MKYHWISTSATLIIWFNILGTLLNEHGISTVTFDYICGLLALNLLFLFFLSECRWILPTFWLRGNRILKKPSIDNLYYHRSLFVVQRVSPNDSDFVAPEPVHTNLRAQSWSSSWFRGHLLNGFCLNSTVSPTFCSRVVSKHFPRKSWRLKSVGIFYNDDIGRITHFSPHK